MGTSNQVVIHTYNLKYSRETEARELQAQHVCVRYLFQYPVINVVIMYDKHTNKNFFRNINNRKKLFEAQRLTALRIR